MGKQKVKLSVHFPEELANWTKETATKNGFSVSTFLTNLTLKYKNGELIDTKPQNKTKNEEDFNLEQYLKDFAEMEKYYSNETDIMPAVLADCNYEKRMGLFGGFLWWRALFDVVQNEKTRVNAIFPECIQYVPKLNENFKYDNEWNKAVVKYAIAGYFSYLEEKKVYEECIENFEKAMEKLKRLGVKNPQEEPPKAPTTIINDRKVSMIAIFRVINQCELLNKNSELIKKLMRKNP